jgi:glycosyltransferase involved in cell wall biosynthesis
LIRAISDLPNEIRQNLICLFIGGGSMQKQLEEEITTYELEDNIILTGRVKHEELNLYMNSADIFSLSSDSEGNPTVMFEALGVGLPYIGTNAGGVSEIITSEEYGLVSPIGDRQALRQNIQKGLKKAWDEFAIRRYAQQFTWKNIFLQTRELY